MPSRVETQVNTHIAGSQDSPQITTLSDGGWVITWTSYQQDGSFAGVFAQAYGPDGAPRGSEFQVNTHATGNQYGQQIAALDDGGWVIAWQSQDQDGDGWGVFAQAFNADGTAQGGEVQVNSFQIGDQEIRGITALSSGGWVVLWNSDGQDGSGEGVFARAFDANGTALGPGFQVNTYATSSQFALNAAALSDGGWVIAWQSMGQDGSGNGMYLQAYNADGSPRGGEVRVNSYTPGGQDSGQVLALADGGYVLVWTSEGQDGDGDGIFFRAYDADGTLRGPEMQVNTYWASAQVAPDVALLADGGWVAMWTSYGQDWTEPSQSGVFAQAFNADGTLRGGEIQVNTHEPGSQFGHNLTALAGGGWVATWESDGQDGSGPGVYAQVFAADGTRVGAEIQVNTHTASFQDYPQTTALPNGGFTVTWRSYNQDGEFSGVYSRVFAPLDPDTISVTLSGTQTVGETLSAQITGIDPADGTLDITYIWTVDGVVVAAGPSADFTLTADHANAIVAVAVHIDDSLFADPGVENAPATGPIDDGNNDPTGAITFSSSNANPNRYTVGDTVTADDSAIADADGLSAFSYQWLRDGVPIAGAIAASYLITADDEGRQLTLVVTYTDGAGFDEAITSPAAKVSGFSGDVIFGDNSPEMLIGTVFNDQLVGRGGDDTLDGGAGRDILNGQDGDDLILGGEGFDRLKGNDGNDTLMGDGDRDRLSGGSGNDLLVGNHGDDVISGGGGADRLRGGAGNDRLLGNGGADTFIFSANDGVDSIKDFEDGLDMIRMSGGATFGDLAIAQAGAHVTITYGATVITVENILFANITEDDFIL